MKDFFNKVSDLHIYLFLAAVCVVSRLPFLGTFDVVSYDGTYYLGQARELFSGRMPGAFPVGYPLAVRCVQILVRDYQTAGMTVSFLAAVGSVVLVFRLTRRFAGRSFAFLAAAALAVNPLFIRYSLMTMSESIYIFWVLLGLWMFAEKRWLPFGLAMGLAVITRPEAVIIVALLAASRIRKPGQVALIAASFLAVYAVNVAVLSASRGSLVVASKLDLFGSGAAQWKLREASFEFEGRDELVADIEDEGERTDILSFYVRRLPDEMKLLIANVWPAVVLLALYAGRRRRYIFMAAALAAFLINPLFIPREEERFILPYIPVLYILAVLGTADLVNMWQRRVAAALVVLTAAALPAVNRAAVLEPEDPLIRNTKTAALAMRDTVNPGDRIASRKPFFAFYTRGDYVEIPLAPYEDIMNHAVGENVRFIELHQPTIHQLRPMLRPLMYSTAVLNGELRYRQVYFDPSGEMVLERTRAGQSLRWTRLTDTPGRDVMPAWAPDGGRIAFRSESGGGIFVMNSDGSGLRRVAQAGNRDDGLTWSPDGGRIAFADGETGGASIYAVDVASGEVRLIVGGEGNNVSPSWSPTGGEIIFCSDRSGQPEIWVCVLSDGALHRLTTDGGNLYPRVSPGARAIAWIKKDGGIVIMDSARRRIFRLGTPRRVHFAPVWSPDGRYLAVTGDDWGSRDIYLMKTDGTGALLLTKNQRNDDSMPAWSPDGSRIAMASDLDSGAVCIWVVEGLRPYLERLDSPVDARVFIPPGKP